MWIKTILALIVLAFASGCGEGNVDGDLIDEILDVKNESTANQRSFSGRSIVFYNVENLFDTKDDPNKDDDEFTPGGFKKWDDERYEKKLDRIEDALSLFKDPPLLIGLVEVENREVLEDLKVQGDFRRVSYGIVHFESPDRRGIDVGLLYDKDAFKVIESEKIAVKLDYDQKFATRDILYVEGELSSGERLHVFVNHWSSRREGKSETEHKRMEAAETLREQVDELFSDDPNANIVILGDFNDHPNDKSLEIVLRAKESGYEKEGDLINLLYDEHMNGEGTSVYENEWAVLDQIIVSQALYDGISGIGIQAKNAVIVRNDKILFKHKSGDEKPSATYGGSKYYGGYSDHLPVYILLK